MTSRITYKVDFRAFAELTLIDTRVEREETKSDFWSSPAAPTRGAEKRITFSEQPIQPQPGDETFLWVHWDSTPVFPPNPGLTILIPPRRRQA